ncbi:PKD domain-containing protein [Pseudoalteromonas sp. SSM20]|uniref:PKD domain-containing protein n=1 Tax=Pseudoalteromonas sp. SSM20 TaxID=3139394 RepID=UPI003BAACC3F
MIKNSFKLSLISSALLLVGCGGSDKKEEVVIVENSLPTVSLNAVSINENKPVTVKASANDSDGKIATYEWTVTSEHEIQLENASSAEVSFTAPSVSDEGDIITLNVKVTDDDGASASAETNITVANVVPMVSFPTLTMNEKETKTLTATIDGAGDEVKNVNWSIVESDSGLELSNANTPVVNISAPELRETKSFTLSLSVEDVDGDITSLSNLITINQLTIPLTISGLATDSPIKNAIITVSVGGQQVDVEATADENGNYTINLTLDDSDSTSILSIVAKGVEEQANAGLISLLGTVGELTNLAGDDQTLTSDESFSVNVTNISTAEYALAKLANEGDAIASDDELRALKSGLNYDEVMTLATAIKVAIDKASENPDLALPEGTSDTLELIENIEQTKDYVQEVINTPEFEEAQQEIYEDDTLIDNSGYVVPEKYYVTDQDVMIFNDDNTGASSRGKYTWQLTDSTISINYIEPKKDIVLEWIDNGDGTSTQVEVSRYTKTTELKRLNSSEQQDTLLVTSTTVIDYLNDELTDYEESNTYTVTGIKEAGVSPISISSGKGYFRIPSETINDVFIMADEISLNENGSASFKLTNADLNANLVWKIENGKLELSDLNNPDAGKLVYSQVGATGAHKQFSREYYNEGKSVPEYSITGIGNIVHEQLQWNLIPGVYDYDSSFMGSDSSKFFFVLHDNGDADTVSASDENENGVFDPEEIFVMYGSWYVNSDGTLSITRIRNKLTGEYDVNCRKVSEQCGLFHTRIWKLTGTLGTKRALFHKHHFTYSNIWPEWYTPADDLIQWDNREVYKRDSSPIDYTKAKVNKKSVRSIIGKRFTELGPIKR